MGAGASRSAYNGIILTFDALGTLYRFRAPVANQYLAVAKKCGLKSTINESDLQMSFKRAFKALSNEFPNYGKGKLDNPEVWWSELVKRSFKDVVENENLPDGLESDLYQHFSSQAAYELYPDVRSLLHRTREIRAVSDSPPLLLGIITNGDPRVSSVLRSMGLSIGQSRRTNYGVDEIRQAARDDAQTMSSTGQLKVTVPWQHSYNSNNDFDFLTTSYDAESEKPHPGIFESAELQATEMILSKAAQSMPDPKTMVGGIAQLVTSTLNVRKLAEKMIWIHVGDDYDTDYVGAEAQGLQSLLLVREGEGKEAKGATSTVSNMVEVTQILNLLVKEQMKQKE